MGSDCPIHEGRRAHRVCRRCGRPMCALCEVRMRGHYFCSTRCARDAGRQSALWHRASETANIEVPSRLALLAVALASVAPVVLGMRAVGELDRLNEPSRFTITRRGPSARIDSIRETPGGAVVEGHGPAGAAVFLFANGRLAGTTSVEADRFRFEGITAKGPYRVGAVFLSPEASAPAPPPDVAPSPRRPVAPSSDVVAAAPPAAASAPAPLRPTPVLGRTRPEPAAQTPPLVAAASVGSRPAFPARVLDTRPEGAPAEALTFPDMTIGPRDRREILVSFDAGSSDRGALQILDALKERGIRTTIFLTGDFIRRSPELARRIAEDGHEVGNHTDSHPHLTTYALNGRQATRPGVDRAFLARELGRTARLYRETTGKAIAPVWRAPFGEHNPEIRRWAAEEGYWHVGWTGGRAGLDSLDWISDPASPAYRSADKVVALLVQRAENGGIVLLHLGSDRDVPVASRIGGLFDGLAGRGFRFTRATEFLDREGMTVERLASLSGRGGPAAR
jgi:peptidoglycan/xylan/chitin deacetylase (PgdA/CDA1 family)